MDGGQSSAEREGVRAQSSEQRVLLEVCAA